MSFSVKIIFFVFISLNIFSQEKRDSSIFLSEVIVKGFETERPLLETAGSINVLKTNDLTRQNTNTLLPAINTLPGVRMEERSPGSYRLNIRGSSLRSPFGVRNVKIYWNDIQLTDANGNTYLNAIEPATLGSIEILKGPGSSIYGAGTGGVVLLNSKSGNGLEANLQYGSFNSLRAGVQGGKTTSKTSQYYHQFYQKFDGYRDHSNMQKIASSANLSFFLNEKQSFHVVALYTSLDYRTPGGLNLAQTDANPKAARPRAGQIAGSQEQNAGINQQNGLLGFSFSQKIKNNWMFHGSLNGAIALIKNPFITNYEKRNEQTAAARSRFVYGNKINKTAYKITFGGELNTTFSTIDNYGNKAGKIDTVQFNDTVLMNQNFIFSQAEFEIRKNTIITLGGSLNQTGFNYQFSSRGQKGQIIKKLPLNFSPRLAILKKFSDKISTYFTYSQGFAPPSVAEYASTTRLASSDLNLNSETAKNYEIGLRGRLLKVIYFDVNHYRFNLENTVVRRVNAAGNQYFVNAGKTNQNGIEVLIQSSFQTKKNAQFNPFFSLNLSDYTFDDYIQIKTDLSGKNLAGVPKYNIVGGFDFKLKNKLHLNVTSNWIDTIPLNDINTVFAKKYTLLSGKISYLFQKNKLSVLPYFGIENALNQQYSLGNDFNAAVNRFYNPAPARNYFGGISVKF